MQRAEQEPAPAHWDPAAFSCLCSFPPPATMHTRRGELGHSCHRAEKDRDAGEQERRHLSRAEGSCTEPFSVSPALSPFIPGLFPVLSALSEHSAAALL